MSPRRSDPPSAGEDGSLRPVDLDTHFFEGSVRAGVEDDEHGLDPRLARKLTPMAERRRAQLTKYVTIAVGLASALCLVALVKAAGARAHDGGEPGSAGASQAVAAKAVYPQFDAPPRSSERREAKLAEVPPPPDVPAEPEIAAPPDPTATGPAAPVAAAEPSVQGTAPAAAAADTTVPAPAKSDPPSTPNAPSAPSVANAPAVTAPAAVAASPIESNAAPSTPEPVEAGKQKSVSRAALERGNYARAIEAGERSVALDPTDAEAWLILGASYQEKGDWRQARRCYRSCLTQGKRGNRSECQAMIR
jgi:hypothetical protein